MRIKHGLKTAISGIRTHKSRSALTILGIVIGITSIILVQSIGQGAQNMILSLVQGLGSQTIVVEPGKEPSGASDMAEIFANSLKQKDLDLIRRKENVPGAAFAAPMVLRPTTVSYADETLRQSVLGTSEDVSRILEIYPEEGMFFTDDDVRQRSSVVVLGSKVKEKLFGQSSALGEQIKIKGKTFRVIGILAPAGQVGMLNVDDMVAIPYTTAMKYITGTDYLNVIMVRATSEDVVEQTVNDIRATLRESHGIDEKGTDDFHTMSQAEAAKRVSMITDALTALLMSIAAISLVVGGIGIMNIMLVSVTERTKEIGIRKAIGATEGDILTQFLIEAVVLTALGGVVGVTLGAVLSYLAAVIMTTFVAATWEFSFPISAAIIGLSVSTIVGLIFGIYPARQAAKKDPIEALRYE